MHRGSSRQISFREKEELAKKIVEAAKVEDRDLADFVRKLVRLAFREYETAGSLHAMRVRVDAAEEAKRQVEIESRVLNEGKRGKSEETKKKRKAS
jgi:hypothetical protein